MALFPAFGMAVVAQRECRDTPLRITIEEEACRGGAVGIEEGGRGFRAQLGDLALQIFLKELFALAIDGEDEVAVFVEILAGQGVENGRRERGDGRE